MTRLTPLLFASAALTLGLTSGCDDGASTGGGGAASSSTASTATASTSGATTTGATTSVAGSSSSGMAMPIPFACGPDNKCDATKEYCEEFLGVVLQYSCKPHAPCPNKPTVECSCLDIADMQCNSCMSRPGGGTTLNCGQG